MTISAIFKSALPSFQYLFKNGVPAVFIGGRYMTSKPEQIAELAAEVGNIGQNKSNHPYIYVDEDEQEIDSEALSPIELIKLQAKEEARKELLAEQAAASSRALDPGANVSSSEGGDFAASLASSNNIAQAGDSNSVVGTPVATANTTNGATAVPVSSMSAKLAALKTN